MVLVGEDLGIITDQLYAESTEFGEVTIKALDSGFMNFIIATAKDKPLNVAKDVVQIKYIGKMLKDHSFLCSSLRYLVLFVFFFVLFDIFLSFSFAKLRSICIYVYWAIPEIVRTPYVEEV